MNWKNVDVLMVTGGILSANFFKKISAEIEYKSLVCVDRGYDVVLQAGLHPEYLIGDFDSVSRSGYDRLKEEKEQYGAKLLALNPVKDATDTEEAFLLIEREFGKRPLKVTLLGGTGGRMDHLLALFYHLRVLLERGIEVAVIDEQNLLWLEKKPVELYRSKQYGTYISFLPATPVVKGLTLRGLRYPLENFDYEMGSGLCVSNEFAEEVAEVDFSEGVLVIIESKDGGSVLV